jgi:two-component system, NtrC family, sensor kinase
MRFLYVLLFFAFSAEVVIGQQNLPPVYEIKNDTASFVQLKDIYWQMLEDPEGSWTIDEVSRQPLTGKFHINTTKPNEILAVNYAINTFWMRYRLKNSMMHEARITIPKNVTHTDFFTPASGNTWNHKMTGTTVPWSKRDDLRRITTLTYTIQPGQELLIYERDNFDYFINTPDFLAINFGFKDNVVQKYYDDNDSSILPSFVFGVFLLAALFNLYFFLIVQRRVYMFFSLILLFNGLMRFFSSIAIFRELPIANWYLVQGSGVLFFSFLIQFVRYFFETFKYFPRWDKYLFGLSIYYMINFILLKNNIIPFIYTDVTGPGIVMVSILITFILFLHSHASGVRLAIVAVSPVICIMTIPSLVVIFKFLNEYTGIPMPAFLEWIWVNNRFPVSEQIGLVWMLIFFSWSLFQRYRQLQIQVTQETLAKEKLAKEKEIERAQLIARQKVQLEKEVEERTAELKQSLENLRATQSQLVQREKMASLGELTAGIAHEIQNPLNFVNNFSEVNKELLAEMNEEIEKGNFNEVKIIAGDVSENEEKINHHGKRADAIVKGMLQHSRVSTGQKELANINTLADEYLRLSYHGLRAKDKIFNATLQTDFDRDLDKINVIPQDIGRVLLNLYNNAFYSVNERKKQQPEARLDDEVGQGYEPTVSVTTRKIDGKVEIKVKDNGNGIPQKVSDKIFQPFFTTKPTGQGTGLGLSLSYDIIRAHGGDLKVETKEGHGAEFIIQLPIV